MLTDEPEPPRQGARDRVARQRAAVARDYTAEWSKFAAERTDAIEKIVAIALRLHRTTAAGPKKLHIDDVWRGLAQETGEALDHNHRAPASRWLMKHHEELAGRFRTRETPGDPTRAR